MIRTCLYGACFIFLSFFFSLSFRWLVLDETQISNATTACFTYEFAWFLRHSATFFLAFRHVCSFGVIFVIIWHTIYVTINSNAVDTTIRFTIPFQFWLSSQLMRFVLSAMRCCWAPAKNRDDGKNFICIFGTPPKKKHTHDNPRTRCAHRASYMMAVVRNLITDYPEWMCASVLASIHWKYSNWTIHRCQLETASLQPKLNNSEFFFFFCTNLLYAYIVCVYECRKYAKLPKSGCKLSHFQLTAVLWCLKICIVYGLTIYWVFIKCVWQFASLFFIGEAHWKYYAQNKLLPSKNA